jgi:hypothetical protein
MKAAGSLMAEPSQRRRRDGSTVLPSSSSPVDQLRGFPILAPRRHNQDAVPTRSRWTGVEKGVFYGGIADNPAPGTHIGPDQNSSIGPQSLTRKPNALGARFPRSHRDDIADFPGLGPDPNVRSRKEPQGDPTLHAHAELKLNTLSRTLSGPFDTEARTDHIDVLVRSKRQIPGPGDYSLRSDDLSVGGGRVSEAHPPSMLDCAVAAKAHVPPPTHGLCHNMEVLSNKGHRAVAHHFPSKLISSNSQTTIQNAVMQNWSTANDYGPVRCSSDQGFNQQWQSSRKNAPAYSFGSKARSNGARQRFQGKFGTKTAKGAGQQARMQAAPRVQKRDDFAKFFGYNPNASNGDLEQYFGYQRTLQEAPFCESLCDTPGKVGARDLVKQAKKRRKKRRVKRQPVPAYGLNETWQKEFGRAASYATPAMTPGPGTHEHERSGALGRQVRSQYKTEGPCGFGTD